jgi:hypothetical protein
MTTRETPPEPRDKGPRPNDAPASCASETGVASVQLPSGCASEVKGAGTEGAHQLSSNENAAATQKQDATRDGANGKIPWAFVVNFFLLVAGGTWLCFWLLYYTDKFDDFAKILALGGGLTWLAFVLKLLSEDRLKSLQKAADRLVFSNWLVTVLLVVACIAGYWGRAHYGTLQVELLEGSEDRTLTVKVGETSQEPRRLLPGDKVRVLAWTSQKKPTPLYVKVSGYPDLRVSISPHDRRELRIPASFIRRVILLKPTPKLIAHRTDGFRVLVTLNSGARKEIPFDGSPIWIGADEDVFVPHTMLERWRDSLSEDVRSDVMSYWQHPRALTAVGFDLTAGERVCVEFLRKGGTRYSRKDITVRALEPNQDFPQEEEIDARSDENSPDPPSC